MKSTWGLTELYKQGLLGYSSTFTFQCSCCSRQSETCTELLPMYLISPPCRGMVCMTPKLGLHDTFNLEAASCRNSLCFALSPSCWCMSAYLLAVSWCIAHASMQVDASMQVCKWMNPVQQPVCNIHVNNNIICIAHRSSKSQCSSQ